VDERVVGLAPIVIDALNMERHFPHQVEAWGAPSIEIAPYTELGLDTILASPEGQPLRQIVDPYSYRARLPQPKLVILATNDEFFPLDSANLYFADLLEPKRLLYLPNEPHSVERYEPVVRGLRALQEAADGGEPLPRVEWEYAAAGDSGGTVLCVRANDARTLQLWRAASRDRDFRDDEWRPAPVVREGQAQFALPRPTDGYEAVFAQAAFGRGLRAFTLSTGLAVVAGPGLPAYGTKPLGQVGLCAAIAGAAAR
jgi:PhoPQ-activated pathogenicity-related protein